LANALPEDLSAALRNLAVGRSRRDLASRAQDISARYRELVPSAGHVSAGEDALAYGLSRMPATYAAVSEVLAEAQALLPDFAPASLLDVGAGPGTASWAAAAAWPDLRRITMLDHNRELLALAGSLAAEAEASALRDAQRIEGDVSRDLGSEKFDIVVMAYALTELPDERIAAVAADLWARTQDLLIVVEPGRTRDYLRLMRLRSELIAAGATIAAPCPHDAACPLPQGDWCHFSVRLARSRDHQALKAASLGYEDEKFSYLVAARPHLGVARGWHRLIKPPAVSKFAADLPLCTPDGLRDERVLKRTGAAFKQARKLSWGERVGSR
jgi:ribosomal protein RSM22 (predicted rRNA methylase)